MASGTRVAETRRRLACALLLGLLVAAVYAPSLDGGFLWDDDEYVSDNANLHDLHGLKRIWLEPRSSPQYYPLVFTSFWAERQLLGAGPRPGRVVNVALHVLNALLLWAVLRRLDVAPAFLIAVVFAVHPVQLESVAWITERKNVLSASFFLASLWAYLAFARVGATRAAGPSSRPGMWVLSLALFVGALLSKTVTVILPAVLLILVWWKHQRVTWRSIVPLVPFLVVAVPFGLLTVWLETHHVGAAGEEWNLSPVGRVMLAGQAAWFYAGKLAWPRPLMFVYPRWLVDTSSPTAYLPSIALVAVVAALFLLRKRIGAGPLVAVLCFLVALFPALGFFDVYPMRYSYVADHFQYLASIGLIALIVALANRALDSPRVPGSRVAAGTALVIALAVTARIEAGKFADIEALWLDTLAKNPDAWIAHNNLGNLRIRQGRLREAREAFQEVLRLRPGSAIAYNNMGTAWFREGDLARALEFHRRAVALDPRYAEAHGNLGVDLVRAGQIDEGLESYRRALRIDPRYAMGHYNLANALARMGRAAEAEAHYREAVGLQPAFALAHYALGMHLLADGRAEEAARSLDEAFRLKPDFALGRYEAANALLQRGEAARAIEHYSAALRIDPGYAEAWCNRGSALMQQGQVEAAISDYREAIRIKPDYAIAHNNLGFALEQHGRRNEAITRYEEALRIDPAYAAARQNLERALGSVPR